ncbi:MAG TPA: tRNA 2-selenouridine(34) synthase MnmH, partial [Bacteroidia bacterium]
AAIVRIERRLGGLAFKQSLEALEKNDLGAVADITLGYYDKAYNHNHVKREFKDVHFVEVERDEPGKNAEAVMRFADKLGL